MEVDNIEPEGQGDHNDIFTDAFADLDNPPGLDEVGQSPNVELRQDQCLVYIYICVCVPHVLFFSLPLPIPSFQELFRTFITEESIAQAFPPPGFVELDESTSMGRNMEIQENYMPEPAMQPQTDGEEEAEDKGDRICALCFRSRGVGWGGVGS